MANTQPVVANKTITIVSKTKNSISIRWTKATDAETAQRNLAYTVTWCVAPYVWDNNIRKIGEKKYDNDNYVITGLTPNTTYDIIIYVRDEGGWENTYNKITVTTPADEIPNTPPKIYNNEVTIRNKTSNSITLAWQKAVDNETAQKDLSYVITYQPQGEPRKQTSFSKDINSYTLSGLVPNTTYTIIVWVYDGKAYASYKPITVTMSNTGSSGSNSAPTGDRKKDINNYLRAITYSPACLINNELYNDKTIYPTFIENKLEGAGYILKTTNTQNSSKELYVRGTGYENIYPGSILVVDSEITSGSPNPLGNVGRAPVKIYGDFLAGSNTTQIVNNPTNNNVHTACTQIMRILLNDSAYKAPGMQAPKTKIYTSQKSLMFDLKVDSNFAGVNVNVNADVKSSEQSFVQATTLEQDYFTVKLSDAWKQDPSSLFADSVSLNDIKTAAKGRALAIVTSVTYGRTFSYLKEYSCKKFTYDGSQKVKGYGQSVESSQSTAETTEYTNASIFNLGGTPLSVAALKSKKTQEELEAAMADNMDFSPSNQGVVTKFTIQLITGDAPGKVLQPCYDVKTYRTEYIRCPHTLQVYVNVGPVYIGGPGGGDVQVHIDPKIISPSGSNDYRVVQTIDGNSSKNVQDPWWYTFNNSRTRQYGNLAEGQYIYPTATLRVLARSIKTKKFSTHDSKIIDISSGDIAAYLKGSVLSNVSIDRVETQK